MKAVSHFPQEVLKLLRLTWQDAVNLCLELGQLLRDVLVGVCVVAADAALHAVVVKRLHREEVRVLTVFTVHP